MASYAYCDQVHLISRIDPQFKSISCCWAQIPKLEISGLHTWINLISIVSFVNHKVVTIDFLAFDLIHVWETFGIHVFKCYIEFQIIWLANFEVNDFGIFY